MKKYITVFLMLLLVGAGVAHAQSCTVNYSTSYAVYTSESVGTVVNETSTGTPGTATITIGGAERQKKGDCANYNLKTGNCTRYDWYFDTGVVSINVNGFVASANYAQGSTTSTVAAALAAGLANSLVNATANLNVITLTAKTPGAGTNYSLSTSAGTTNGSYFTGTSFTATPSGSTLSGGSGTTATGHILTSVLVDGAASMNIVQGSCPDPVYQQLLAQVPTATHTPQTTNVVNGVGGTFNGGAGCVTCYLSSQDTEDSGAVPVGVPVVFSSGGLVFCSVGGQIFNPPNISNYAEVAITASVKTGASVGPDPLGGFVTPVGPYCDAQHYPPDFNPIFADTYSSTASYFLGVAICVRLGTGWPWICSPGIAQPLFYNPQPWPCTHNP